MRNERFNFMRAIPLIIIIFAIALIFYFKLDRFFSLNYLDIHRKLLMGWVHSNYWQSVGLFAIIYIVLTSLSIPGAFFTLTGGFLFGTTNGAIFSVVSTTVGATCLFLVVKFSVGNWLGTRNKKWIVKMQQGVQKNAFLYILLLRFIPIVSFPFVNIASGSLNVKTRIFVIASLIGIIPSTVIFSYLGNNFMHVVATGSSDILSLLSPSIYWPIILLMVMSLIPFAYTYYSNHKAQSKVTS